MTNKYISQGSFPDCLKIAHVIQFKKKDQKLTVVTLVQFPSYLLYQKSLKKLSLLNCMDYIEKKATFICLSVWISTKLLYFPTSLAISNICNNILLNKDKGFYTCSIFLDLSKAFDTVDHALLINKFENCYGINGIPVCLLNNYLFNQFQYTCINNTI